MADQTTAPAGWHRAEDDPPGVLRYWDGLEWTDHLADGAVIDLTDSSSQSNVAVASGGIRVAARWTDRMLTGSFGGGAFFAFGGFGGDGVGAVIAWTFWVFTTVVLSTVVVDTVFLHRLGATPGKLLFGLVVVDLHDAPALSKGQAFRRSFLGVFSSFAIPLGLISGGFATLPAFLVALVIGLVSLVMLFVGDQRTVHDRVGKTRVVKRADLGPGAAI